MSKVLVISYSQTGQLDRILHSICEPLAANGVELEHVPLVPERPYPFPWSRVGFFNEFPESVFNIPTRMKPIGPLAHDHYDLIIVGYTVWYLNPSIPFNSFLMGPDAKRMLANTKVITVIGARNMWVMAQEKVRAQLAQLGATTVANIALVDRNPNLVSIITVIRWMFWNIKEKTALWPRAGILEEDIAGAARFGHSIALSLKKGSFQGLNEELRSLGSAQIDPSLLILEKRALKLFNLYGKFILAKGQHDDPARLGRVSALSILLPIGAFILSPVTALSTAIISIIKKKELQAETDQLLRY